MATLTAFAQGPRSFGGHRFRLPTRSALATVLVLACSTTFDAARAFDFDDVLDLLPGGGDGEEHNKASGTLRYFSDSECKTALLEGELDSPPADLGIDASEAVEVDFSSRECLEYHSFDTPDEESTEWAKMTKCAPGGQIQLEIYDNSQCHAGENGAGSRGNGRSPRGGGRSRRGEDTTGKDANEKGGNSNDQGDKGSKGHGKGTDGTADKADKDSKDEERRTRRAEEQRNGPEKQARGGSNNRNVRIDTKRDGECYQDASGDWSSVFECDEREHDNMGPAGVAVLLFGGFLICACACTCCYCCRSKNACCFGVLPCCPGSTAKKHRKTGSSSDEFLQNNMLAVPTPAEQHEHETIQALHELPTLTIQAQAFSQDPNAQTTISVQASTHPAQNGYPQKATSTVSPATPPALTDHVAAPVDQRAPASQWTRPGPPAGKEYVVAPNTP